MKFKNIIYVILFFASFAICDKANAMCYNKCEDGTNCYYVEACDQMGKITCSLVDDSYCNIGHSNYNDDDKKSCGNGYIEEIPSFVPKIIRIVYLCIQIAVPVVLVIFGSLDFLKAVSAQKEDEIKKGQQIFIKRLIYAALVFFVFVIVKILISAVADTTGNSILKCAECFIESKCDD